MKSRRLLCIYCGKMIIVKVSLRRVNIYLVQKEMLKDVQFFFFFFEKLKALRDFVEKKRNTKSETIF